MTKRLEEAASKFLLGRAIVKGCYCCEDKTTLLALAEEELQEVDGAPLIEALYTAAKSQWETANGRHNRRRGSKQNWRFKLVPDFDDKRNQRTETRVEKRIAQIAAAGQLLVTSEWANQIPTASGLVDEHADKHANIDLGNQVGPKAYEMIELKTAEQSGHALSAAMEVTRYAALYLFSRLHRKELGYPICGNRWLDAAHIGVRVLAPITYYKSIPGLRKVLVWLEQWLTDGYAGFLGDHAISGFTMDFRFMAFPLEFQCSCDDVLLANSLLGRQKAVDMLATAGTT